jgi:hypothetical protein
VKVSRANFLKSCSIALAGAFVGGAAKLRWNPFEGHQRAARFRLQDATASFFRNYLNDSFTVRPAGEDRTPLVLVKVDECPVTKNVEQFSLIFHGPAGERVRDGTHSFQHPALGNFELFIVAIGIPNDRRVVYQACFSRHLSLAASVVI